MKTEEVNIEGLSAAQIGEVYRRKREEEKAQQEKNREAYLSIRHEFLRAVERRAEKAILGMENFYKLVKGDADAFRNVMQMYGQQRGGCRRSFSVQDDTFRVDVKCSQITRMDERAESAAERLVVFLEDWIKTQEGGHRNPVYKLAMSSIKRTSNGDIQSKSLNDLYDLEEDFASEEYSEIMGLFRESKVVKSLTTHYYFYRRQSPAHPWVRLEPSFNRMNI